MRYEKYENDYAPNVALLKQGSCDAAVVSASFYDNQMGAADKAAVKGIHNTLPLPGVVVTAGPRLTPCRSTPCAATLRSLRRMTARRFCCCARPRCAGCITRTCAECRSRPPSSRVWTSY